MQGTPRLSPNPPQAAFPPSKPSVSDPSPRLEANHATAIEDLHPWYARARAAGSRSSPYDGTRADEWWSPASFVPGGASSRRRSSVSPKARGGVFERAIELGAASLSALWVHEDPTERARRTHVHADDDIAVAPLPSSAAGRLQDVFSRPRALLQLSRWGYTAVCLLLLLGLRELWLFSGRGMPRRPSVRIRSGNPFAALDVLAPRAATHQSHLISALDHHWREEEAVADPALLAVEPGDVTAVVLHWKRTDNVAVIVAHLCQYSFFSTVLIWNNNPDIYLTHSTFAASACPQSKLRIYNSPQNLLFLARYLACSTATTPNCFFQDDDWLVRPIRALYSQFSRDPEGPVVVHTNSDTSILYGLEWCFYQTPLHTCFSWVGTGAFTAKSHVDRFLATISTASYSREELGHADNSFTLFQNEPPYVLSGDLDPLPQPFGHSDGEGIARNKRIIQQGLQHVVDHLRSTLGTPIRGALPAIPIPIDTTSFRTPSAPPLPPHPYSHHARSPCHSDNCVFLTNVALLPPPDAVPYPGPEVVGLEEWENRVGSFARGWIEGGELFVEEEQWARQWPYKAAVDGRWDTAFRSPDVIQANDYVGLGLIAPIDPKWVPEVTLHFVLENAIHLITNLAVEVSSDGHRWASPINVEAIDGRCQETRHRSAIPEISLPSSYLSSPESLTIHEDDQKASSATFLSRWWRRRRRAAQRLSVCSLTVQSGLESTTSGWKFIRLRSETTASVGWGVYQIWLS